MTTAVSAGAHVDGDEDEDEDEDEDKDEDEDGRNRREMARARGNGMGGPLRNRDATGSARASPRVWRAFRRRRAAGAHARRQTVNSFDGGG